MKITPLSLLTTALIVSATLPNAFAQTVRRVYPNVRGQIITLTPAKANQEAAVLIAHEKIPNFMAAMAMTLPLAKASDLKRFKRGDKVRFDMTLRAGTFIAANLRPLPPKTPLQLRTRGVLPSLDKKAR